MKGPSKLRDAGEDDDEGEDLELMEQYDRFSSESDDESDHSRDRLSDEAESDDEPETITSEHYQAIRATVIDICTALGGLEEKTNESTGKVEKVYAIGDDCLRCLRDLRSLLHQDQEDTMRVVPIIFSEVNVVQRGLLPLLLKTAEMGERGSKIALACTDLLTSLTWPIDIVAEQQAAANRESKHSPLESYQRMLDILVSYKLAILRIQTGETRAAKRSALSTIMLHILLPSLSKPRHRRSERDIGTISMCMHLFRNILAIRDPLATSLSGAEAIALSNLQNDLLVELKNAHILETLLMLASNADARDFEAWNVVTAECVYLIYADAYPELILSDRKPTKEDVGSSRTDTRADPAKSLLSRSLAAEGKSKSLEILASGTSRHSRFSTTINFKDDAGNLRIARSQRSLRKSSDQLTMLYKDRVKRKFSRRKNLEEVGAAYARSSWSSSALIVVREWADSFLKTGFECLVRSVVKDIRSEHAKIGNIAQTRTRIMRLSHFFLEYFLLRNASESAFRRASTERYTNQTVNVSEDQCQVPEVQEPIPPEWTFDLIEYWLEPWALKMAWMRAAVAREERSWLEFITAIQLWTTLLRLVDILGRSSEQRLRDMSEGIQAAHFYDELVLDAAKSAIKTYTNQSFRCLETIIEFAHVMPKALERYSKDKDNLFVKMKRHVRSQAKDDKIETNLGEQREQIHQMVESQIRERKFEFEKFQSHLGSDQLLDACLLFVFRYREVSVDRFEHRLGGLLHILHRLAIKAGNTRLFYPYERRTKLKSLKADHAFWLYVQVHAPKVHDDLAKLIKYVLDKFGKLDAEEQAYWAEGVKRQKPVKIFKMPSEIEIVPGEMTMPEQIRLAVTLMVEDGMFDAVMWVKQGYEEAIRQEEAAELRRDIEGVDAEEGDSSRTQVVLDYHGDGRMREWASKNPKMKLLCRLVGLSSLEDDDHDWKWLVGADLTLYDLQCVVEAMQDALKSPFDQPGVDALSLVRRKRNLPKRQKVINEYGEEEEVYVPRGRGPRKARQTFIDDDMIEDSDEEIEMAARMLAERHAGDEEGPEDGARLDPSASVNRASSDSTSPSRVGRSEASSPASSLASVFQRPSALKKKQLESEKANRSGLFLGSDDESDTFDNSDGGEENDNERVDELPASRKASNGLYRLLKRPLQVNRSDDEESNADEPSPSDVDVSHASPLSSLANTQVRKRRALIIDDDDDED